MTINNFIKHIPFLTPALSTPTFAVDTPLLCRRAFIIALTAFGTYVAASNKTIPLPLNVKHIPKIAVLLVVTDFLLTKISSLRFYQKEPELPTTEFVYKGIPSYMALLTTSESLENDLRALDSLHPLSFEEIQVLYLNVALSGCHRMLENLLKLPYNVFSNLKAPINILEILKGYEHELTPPIIAALQLELNHR